ncbi:hypothetical protein G6F57_013298 [Rhizopus arrhizus]|uniref:Integrase catalytic domain-containing protein n=1 Tax=Rhizopus oryzae TaxID=64495 RepID=A0A9P6WXP3_RHIOR|nr:hypothetical protein G6F65_013715 [Rhizopus arrhizus]KAG1300829.1 hypothetical protein G6F64_012345 [Rhizopus arrhizus]KAG1325050.1 hypothetical protein G6F63_012322 [Rhizopus arrhizus]KAG1407483.1 hypothetical protein G6F59_012304 [Rhizopus arrhizus]KAG1466176.1 hypothetical protein G6F57_013298 [Rhizopus arrhizus]
MRPVLTATEPKGRIARWILAIQGYSFTIVHRKGALNVDADALSRRDQVNSQEIQAGKVNEAPSQGRSGVGAVQFLSGILQLKAEQLEDKVIQTILKEDVKKPYAFKDDILWYQYDDGSMVPITPQSMVKSLLRSVHNLPTGGHYGVDKTLAKVRLLGWWPTMIDDVKQWIRTCDECQRYKIRNDSAVPPMKPIIPSRIGEIWALDIAMLPLSTAGNRYLLVMCEYLSKWTIAVALPSYDTDHIAQALLYELVLKFSVPTRLITDNGSSLVGDAMTQVCARLGIKRSLTSVEHPQTDGLVERMNRALKTSLATAVHSEPTKWDSYLQFITFAYCRVCTKDRTYNTAKHASTGFSPFQVMFGRQPVLPNEQGLILPTFKTYETETWVNYLNKYIPLLHGKVLQNIKTAQGHQKTFYDKGKRVKYDYKIGDLILRKNLEKTSFPKELWIGPYIILSKNNSEGTSYKIVKRGASHEYVTTANVRHMRPYHEDQDAKATLLGGKQCNKNQVPTSYYWLDCASTI